MLPRGRTLPYDAWRRRHRLLVVILLTLYEDWVPFLVSIVFVLAHHALVGGIPLTTAAVHAGFLMAAAGGLLAVWRFNEDVRHRLRALVDGSGDAIVEIDRKGEVVGWNAAAQAMLGYSLEEIECQPASVLAAPGRGEELDHVVDSALHGEPIQRHEM